MPQPAAPEDERDAALAQTLLAAGLLPRDELHELLAQARAARQSDPEATLARWLIDSGRIHEAELRLYQGTGETLPLGGTGAPAFGASGWSEGQRVAGYLVEKVLGRGGMGVVLRARQMGTGRQVALKALSLQGDLRAIERFVREAAVMATVDDHPNVVRVYEAGQAEGHGFLAMELLTGGDLSARLRAGRPPSASRSAEVVAQLARGLAHVHAHGILHRDLKPQNVLFDGQGTPKLVDFGLARIQGARSLTQTGQLVGTPAFMAPEQAIGLKQVDVRTDVYGLGAVLYACLAGRPPFAGALPGVLAQVCTEAPPRPSELCPGLDPALEAICLRAMAKDPADRYPDAGALADALEAWAADPTPRPRPAPRGARFARAAALCGVGLAGGFGLGRLAQGTPAPPPARPLAHAPPQGPTVAAAQPSPDPAEDAAPDPSPPERLRAEDLRVGSLVVAPVKEGSRTVERLTSVVFADRSDPEALKVALLCAGELLGPIEVPPGGFLGDPFGVGARALAEQKGRAETPCTVRRRRGPVALVEFADEERRWLPVLELGLQGPGVDPGEDVEAELVLTRWPSNDHLYVGVVVERDENSGLVRIAHLDGDMIWVSGEELEPLPSPADFLRYKLPDGTRVPAVLIRYPAPWLAEVGRRDNRSHVFVHLDQLRVYPEDRD